MGSKFQMFAFITVCGLVGQYFNVEYSGWVIFVGLVGLIWES